MKKEIKTVQNVNTETNIDLTLDDSTAVTIDVDASQLEGMDFADRMEYFWNLSEE